MKISENVLDVLGECRVDGNVVYLPAIQLERTLYEAVNKILVKLGGKWNRKAKGHVFDRSPAEALESVILCGEVTDQKKVFQFFPTPRAIGERLCDLAEINSECVVLEPSCGKGDLTDVIYERHPKELYAVEMNEEMKFYLDQKMYPMFMRFCDFLEYEPTRKYDRIIMNPPFSNHQDVDHIRKAYEILKDGGVLVSVVSCSPFFRTDKKSVAFREFLDEVGAYVEEVPEGAFKESGTMVRTKIIKITKP
ncbi:MAG: class I SAM-dependent methyltransferase [Clostridia bacterium]|nr:class I SAM-dependent methyltransferase [Clostridia bacterium]